MKEIYDATIEWWNQLPYKEKLDVCLALLSLVLLITATTLTIMWYSFKLFIILFLFVWGNNISVYLGRKNK